MSDPNSLGIYLERLDKKTRMVGYLALQSDGKVKSNERHVKESVRSAVLGSSVIDEKTGNVDWVGGTIHLKDEQEFELLLKCMRKLFDGDGVEFDLIEYANALLDALEAKDAELRALKKAQETAKK